MKMKSLKFNAKKSTNAREKNDHDEDDMRRGGRVNKSGGGLPTAGMDAQAATDMIVNGPRKIRAPAPAAAPAAPTASYIDGNANAARLATVQSADAMKAAKLREMMRKRGDFKKRGGVVKGKK